MIMQRPLKVTLRVVFGIIVVASMYASVILVGNLIGLKLVDLIVGSEIFQYAGLALAIEGLTLAVWAISDLTNRGDAARRFPYINLFVRWSVIAEALSLDYKKLGRSIVDAIVALTGVTLFAAGFLLLELTGF
jgi:hypothetical protein